MNIISGTLTSSNSQQRLTSGASVFRDATFFAFKSFNSTGINNSSGVWVGPNQGLLVNYLLPGESINYSLPVQDYNYGKWEDLSNYYFQGNSGDGLVVFYY